MKKSIYIILGLCTVILTLAMVSNAQVDNALALIDKRTQEKLKDGDIIFQTSQSPQCEAVRIATNSKFSHCGIIYTINGEKYVYEAVQPVKITPFKEWITHGLGYNYLVKRLKDNTQLSESAIYQMKTYGKQFENKDYDLYFEWDDNRIYCSELVWKIYKNGAGIELCPLKELQSFQLNHEIVKNILRERYGDEIPLHEKVVSPSQIAESPLLITVEDTY